MLIERTIVDQIEIKQDGVIFLKELNQIIRDDLVISSSPHRTTFTPDMSLNDIPELVKPIATLTWTKEIIESYNEFMKKTRV